MCYILYMNKDVIYVEPEDDITDIILKIEKSKERIVALVPPKKAGVFRSVVNIKLISKSGMTSGKKIVLVTTDPSIVRLAGSAKIPVTKDLQTAPSIPSVEVSDSEVASKEELVEESDGTVETKEDVEELEKEDKKKIEDDGEEDGEDEDEVVEEKPAPKTKTAKKKALKGGNNLINWILEHKKLSIACSVGIIMLILFLVWAFVIAPAVTVTVGIRTTSNNFSENITFTTNQGEERASDGVFYLEEKKIEDIQEVEFEATGEKNIGEKATGEVTVIATVSSRGGTIQVKSGDAFTNSGMTFYADNNVTMSYDGHDDSVCDNADTVSKREFDKQGCRIYAKVKVTAAAAGSAYNISARESGWDTTAPVSAYSANAMSGGTDELIKVVQQSDIDKAKESLASSNQKENKTNLLEEARIDTLVIESSFNQTTAEAISTPGLGEEVKNGEKAKLKAVTTASVYVIDKTKVEEFIREKAAIADSQKIYEMKDPFIDNFSKSSSGYIGKLKTSYLTGPELSVSKIVDLIKGKGLGDAQHTLKDINGVTEVKMEGSYPWVMSVPNDSNRVTINLDIKDQSGNKIEQSEENKNDTSETEQEQSETQDKKEQ